MLTQSKHRRYTDIMDAFNLRMERNRYARTVTQSELAGELGWKRHTIIDIELGRTRPNAEDEAVLRDTIRRLATRQKQTANT